MPTLSNGQQFTELHWLGFSSTAGADTMVFLFTGRSTNTCGASPRGVNVSLKRRGVFLPAASIIDVPAYGLVTLRAELAK